MYLVDMLLLRWILILTISSQLQEKTSLFKSEFVTNGLPIFLQLLRSNAIDDETYISIVEIILDLLNDSKDFSKKDSNSISKISLDTCNVIVSDYMNVSSFLDALSKSDVLAILLSMKLLTLLVLINQELTNKAILR